MTRWLIILFVGAASFIVTWIIVGSVPGDPRPRTADVTTSTAAPYAAQAEATDARMAAANAQIVKMNCPNGDGLATQILEIDYAAKTVRLWVKFAAVNTIAGHTNGPWGPFPATITPETIRWIKDNSVGRARGISHYTINRLKRTLDIVIDNGPEEDGWQRLDRPCTEF